MSQPLLYEMEALQLWKTTVCRTKTMRRYDSLPILAAKYTHAQTVFTLSNVINRVEHARSIVIIKHN